MKFEMRAPHHINTINHVILGAFRPKILYVRRQIRIDYQHEI